MLSFQLLAQQLAYNFSPVAVSIQDPDAWAMQVHDFSPGEEAPAEHTVYITSSESCRRITGQNGDSLFLIVQNGEISIPSAGWIRNYIHFPPHINRLKLFQNVQQLLNRSVRIANAHRRLSQCLLDRADTNTILKTGAELLGNPLFLSDTSTRVLNWSDFEQMKTVNDELIQCIIKHNFVTSELFEKYNYKALLPSIEQKEQAFYQKSDYEIKMDRLIVKIVINHRYFGWIVVIPQNQYFADGDCEILDILANVLSLELERNKSGFTLSYRENLLLELISDRITSLDEFRMRAEGFGWNPGKDFYTMAIGFHDAPLPDNQQRSIIAYKNHLGMIYPNYKAICIGNILYLLLETDKLESVVSNLENFFQTYHLAAGCSHHFSNILDFGSYVEQAAEILQIGIKMRPWQNIYRYQEYSLPYLVSVLKKCSDPQLFCLPEIQELRDYDKKHDTCYMETLRAYLEFRNILTTAEHLHIHRNTINYRLQKIREITHLSLNEGEDLYKIWLTCLILDFK